MNRLCLPIVIRLSQASKMPCPSYSLPAEACKTGGKLRKVSGSVCSKCYARKGRYQMPNVKEPRDWNLQVWQECSTSIGGMQDWVDAMEAAISRTNCKHFRFFDSGDIQSMNMLDCIVTVCKRLPDVLFWLPTHEKALVDRFPDEFPENLIIRQSAAMLGELEPAVRSDIRTCSVGVHESRSRQCIAYSQGGKCLECRLCWNKSIININYPLH